MEQREQLDTLCLRMVAFDSGDARRIQHFMKVHAFAAMIGRQEHISPHELFVLEAAAYVHDIGIRIALEKYGHETGALQQELGPDAARSMLTECGFSAQDIDRICYLVAHHHTYSSIDGIDYQILVEADFLVNLLERGSGKDEIAHVLKQIFRTETGSMILKEMFALA